MRITPLDIYQKEFKRAMRGFDPDEVEEFLEAIADDYEQVIKENERLKQLVEKMESSKTSEKSRASDKDLQKERAEIIRNAKVEAENIISEARKEAEYLIEKAQDSAQYIKSQSQGSDTKAVSQVLEKARAEANEIINRARDKAESMSNTPGELQAIKDEEIQLRRQISRLQSQKERFFIEYRELLEKHLKFLTENSER
ncbi:DivIVA domain-containing protein [Candidatus Poribacteria bacterium]|nr:DivIVA domain-containing protein [Candidatus Poribacteria bacterium]